MDINGPLSIHWILGVCILGIPRVFYGFFWDNQVESSEFINDVDFKKINKQLMNSDDWLVIFGESLTLLVG